MAQSIDTVQTIHPTVHEVRELTDTAFVVRFDRNGLDFEPGQYVSVGLKGEIDMREYSVYSPAQADYLEILVKEVEHGHVSHRLHRLRPGVELAVDGPFGFFTIDEVDRRRPFLFVATGTGISPFHCFARSYPGLDYRLLHGVRRLAEQYEHDAFEARRVTTCVSREPGAGEDTVFGGRVTDYLRTHPVSPETRCYLCGNCDMIYEAFDILKGHGVPPEQLYAEVYF